MTQMPLALRYPPDQRLDTYVTSEPGIVGLVQDAATVGGEWLYLAGPPGVGKTHLLLAACATAEGAGRRAAYPPLAAAAGRLRECRAAPGRMVRAGDVIAILEDMPGA